MGRVEAPKFQSESVQITKPDERELLKRIWEDKRGREILSTPPEFALYIALPHPKLDLVELGKMLFREMEINPREAYVWSKQWGMTMVGFHPAEQELGVRLLSTSSPERYPYIPIETNIQFKPSEIFESISIGEGRHGIALNDAPTTIEGMAISLTHLLEWAVWEKYLVLKKEEKGESDKALFARAISALRAEGVIIEPVSQDRILARYQTDEQEGVYTVRLYGSGACSAVPFIIGGVLINLGESLGRAETKPNSVVVASVKPSRPTVESLLPDNKEVDFDAVKRPLVVCGATLGKRLHAGHLLTLTVAHIMQAAFGCDEIYFISNNTGPRVAKAMVVYAQEAGISIEEAASLWQRGEVRAWEIERSYRGREAANPENYKRVMKLLPDNDYLISMTNWLNGVLFKIGFPHTRVIAECTYSDLWSPFCSRVDPEWANSGFAFARLGKRGLGGIPLQNRGEYSVVTKFVVAFDELCQTLDKDGIVIVDNTLDASYMAQVARRYLRIGAEQTAGGAVGFGLEMASGTGGEAPPIDRLFGLFKARVETEGKGATEEVLGTEFRNALVHFVNTRWALAPQLAGRQTNFHFEFAKPHFLVQALVRCQRESHDLRQGVQHQIVQLTEQAGKRRQGGKAIREVLRLIKEVEGISPAKVIRAMNTYRRWKPEAHNLYDLAAILEETGHVFSDQIEIANRIAKKQIVLVRRIPPYFQALTRLMETLDEDTVETLPPELAEKASLVLEKTFIRAGYTF